MVELLTELLTTPVNVEDGQISIPIEALLVPVLGGILWLFKGLIAREFKRFEGILERHDRAIEVLQKSDTTQQFDLNQIARLEATVQKQGEELAQQSRDLALLHKHTASLERLQEANGKLSERVQRLDNVGYALKQTQEFLQACQKDILSLKAEVASGYVSEEKYVRELTVLTSRVDAVWERIDSALGSRSHRKETPYGEH